VTATPLPEATQAAESGAAEAPGAENDGILSSSCLWIVAGLVLVAAGVVLLVRRRRPG
jgi:hypothetical protein